MAFDPFFVVKTCPKCGVVYGLQQAHLDGMRDEKGSYCCPNGHWRTFSEGKYDRLQKEITEKNRQLELVNTRYGNLREDLERTERRLFATRGVVTKIRKRVAGGACPCCNRTFQNLGRHMKTKHPDYTRKEEVA